MNQEILIGIVILAICISMFVYFIVDKHNEKIKSVVKETSECYQNMLALNSKYDFYVLPENWIFCKELNSKTQLDKFNYDHFFEEKIQENWMKMGTLDRQVNENRKLLNRYNEEIHDWVAPLREELFVANLKIPFKKYRKYEEKLVKEVTINPRISIYFICRASYVSPKGRNSYSGERTYTVEDLEAHKQHIEEIAKQKETKTYQRRAMTQSLRYDILKRDHFKCVLCGRSAEDGVKLHVDHIIPVSKGGKTVPSNLRTLCEDCNFGKRDKYDAEGIN